MRHGLIGLAAAVALCLAGCGSASSSTSRSSGAASSSAGDGRVSAQGAPSTLAGLLARPGPDVALQAGTSDYAPGRIRVTFLVIDRQGRSILRPRARVWLGPALSARPLATSIATLEPVGIPGASEAAAGGVTRLYVTHVVVPSPGTYFLVAEPIGGRPIQGVLELIVKRHTTAPDVGDKAIPSETPTLRSAHGDLAKLTTASPPDRALLRYSIADSLRAHQPFVVAFATPRFCTSRTCGPVVDVVEAVRRRFARTGIRFIHVEIYEDNDIAKGPNRWVKQWRLPSEPFVFLVGRDGRIKARFEGSVSAAELAAAVRRTLLGRS